MPDKGGTIEFMKSSAVDQKETKMLRKRTAGDVLKKAVGLFLTGTLLATSCSSEGVQAVVDGLLAVAGSLQDSSSDNDLTFGEFLLNELNDLTD